MYINSDTLKKKKDWNRLNLHEVRVWRWTVLFTACFSPLNVWCYWGKTQSNTLFTLLVKCYSHLSLEKAMEPHSSTLAWKIPWTEEPGRLQSMGLLRVGHDWATSLSLFTFLHWRRKWQPTHSSVLAWRIPGAGEPGGLPSLGSHRVGRDWSDLAAPVLVILNWAESVLYSLIFFAFAWAFRSWSTFIGALAIRLERNLIETVKFLSINVLVLGILCPTCSLSNKSVFRGILLNRKAHRLGSWYRL